MILSDAERPLVDGQNITITCTAGRLPGLHLTWMRKLPGKPTWLQLQNNSVTVTTDDVADSGMSLLVSRVKLTLSSSDDRVVYRCLATRGDVTQASSSYTLRVQCKKHLRVMVSCMPHRLLTVCDTVCRTAVRVVVSVSTSRSRDRSTHTNISSWSRIDKNCQCLVFCDRHQISAKSCRSQ